MEWWSGGERFPILQYSIIPIFNMEKPLILLVDDHPKNLQLLGSFLEGAYKTAVAVNGAEALEFVKKKFPDLILLDITMPEMDGLEVCQHLKAFPETQDIPVIFLTARTKTDDVVKGFEVGAVDYITKPFQQKEIMARINTHLTIHNLQKRVKEQNLQLQQEITERKQMEEQIKQAKEELEKLNANKDKFFSIIAHDLRGPLGSLHGLAEILVENIESYSKDKLIRFLTTQRDAAKNLLALLENLLTWSRIQRDMIQFSPQQIDVGDMITQNIALFTPNAGQKQITLKRSIPKQVFVYGDQSMINTVVRNLISNALKFTDSGGTITVSVRQDEMTVEVSVSDTGIGIDAKHVPQLFQIDAKYQRKGTANEQGTGLGLILCKEFVERHGGKLWVESEVGKGTTFTFTLPLPQNLSQPHRQPESSSGTESDQKSELPLFLPPDSDVLPSSAPLVPPLRENLKPLLDAARIGDIMTIRQYAEQLKAVNPLFAPFANRLFWLANNFMTSKIQVFLTQYIEGKP